MAFSLQYLKKFATSQQYDPTLNNIEGDVLGTGLNAWSYQAKAAAANNSTAEVIASGYFNSASGYLSVGDFIFANTNNPAGIILRVATNSSGTVTTTQLV